MAKLKVHGAEIGRLEFITSKVAYFADRTILEDKGSGWKVWGKVKPDRDTHAAFAKRQAKFDALVAACPMWARYRKLMLEYGLEKRLLILTALDMLGDDLDGAWAELNDYGVQVSLEDIQEIASIRALAIPEVKAYNEKIKTLKIQVEKP